MMRETRGRPAGPASSASMRRVPRNPPAPVTRICIGVDGLTGYGGYQATGYGLTKPPSRGSRYEEAGVSAGTEVPAPHEMRTPRSRSFTPEAPMREARSRSPWPETRTQNPVSGRPEAQSPGPEPG